MIYGRRRFTAGIVSAIAIWSALFPLLASAQGRYTLLCSSLKVKVLAKKLEITEAKYEKDEKVILKAIKELFYVYDEVLRYGCSGYINVPPGYMKIKTRMVDKGREEKGEVWAKNEVKRSGEYEFYIKEASRFYRLDQDLIRAIIAVESNGSPMAVSHKGAVGLMQVLPSTGREMGARVDDLKDPRKNILYGSRYLSYLLSLFDGEITKEWLRVRKPKKDPTYRAVMEANEIFKRS